MVTSGTSAFNPMATFLISAAYRKIGAISENEPPSAGMYQTGLFTLNSLVKEWMASGIHVWTEEEGMLFLQPNQSRYLIGGTTTDNATMDTEWVLLTLASSSVVGALTITVDDTTGVDDGDFIGIVLDDNTTQWTLVDGTPTSTVITFEDQLTDSASAGNYGFSYTTKIVRPLRIPRMRRLIYNGLLENPMNIYSRKEYTNLPNKNSPGTPNIFYYSPQLVSGEVFVWPVPNTSQNGARFTWYRPIQDFNNPADTSDLPQEWINTIVWNLAVEFAPDFDIPPQRWQMLKAMADEKLSLVQGWDREPEPIYFTMGYDEAQR